MSHLPTPKTFVGLTALLILAACAHTPVYEVTDEAHVVRAGILKLKQDYADSGDPEARFHVERRLWLPRWDGFRFAAGDPPTSRLALLQGIEHVETCSPPPGARVCEIGPLEHIVLISDISIAGDTAQFIMSVLSADYDGVLDEERNRITVVRQGGDWRVTREKPLYFDSSSGLQDHERVRNRIEASNVCPSGCIRDVSPGDGSHTPASGI